MIVYRVIEDVYSYTRNGISRNEFQDYKNGIISFPKKSYNDGFNTHDYNPNIGYLHFFHFYEGALEYISGIPSMGWDDRCFIASYNIPEELLNQHSGFGLYPESRHPSVPLLEYAIPFFDIRNSFIQGTVEPYHYISQYSDIYKEYMEGGYSSYLEKMDESSKQFIKAFINISRK